MSEVTHVPVLLNEVIEALAPRPGGWFLDLTCGGGGHTRALLEAAGETGFVRGIDRDAELLDETVARLRGEGYSERRFQAAAGSFANLGLLLGAGELLRYDGVVADLGASSAHFDRVERGFSFREPGPLDMRYDRASGATLGDLLEAIDEAGLRRILRDYGEERLPQRALARVARAVIAARDAERLTDTAALAAVIREAYPAWARRAGRIDPATRAFQALRIAVNGELDAVRAGLVKVLDGMKPTARLAVISFHSLEDRIVKRLFRSVAEGEQDFYGKRAAPVARELYRRPVTPSAAEIAANPRARSARLRAVEKLRPGAIVPRQPTADRF